VDVRFLSTFLEVSRTRHFGKAAENLYLTPAAVSARIKHLEESFNTLLFTRVRNGIQLTPAGESLVPFAQSIEQSLKHARAALAQEDVAFLACGLSANASELVLPELSHVLFEHMPNASVKAEVLSAEQLSRQLHERTIEIAFTYEPLKSADIENILLRNEALQMYSDNQDITQLSSQNYLHIEWCSEVTHALTAHYPQIKQSHFRTNSVNIAIKQFQSKGGFLLLPSTIAKQLNLSNAERPKQIDGLLNLKTYMVCMKDGRHPILEELIARLKSDFLLSDNHGAKPVEQSLRV
jgi:DNA-binding transcriptional LysR family regulator